MQDLWNLVPWWWFVNDDDVDDARPLSHWWDDAGDDEKDQSHVVASHLQHVLKKKVVVVVLYQWVQEVIKIILEFGLMNWVFQFSASTIDLLPSGNSQQLSMMHGKCIIIWLKEDALTLELTEVDHQKRSF